MSSGGKVVHGMTRTRAWRAWCEMRKRCQNKNDHAYERYGGRGISVYERWESFANFHADMGDPPPGLSIDRINNDGNYEPGNCRWATVAEQCRNRRSNIWVTIDGRTQCLMDWSREFGIVSYDVAQTRITRYGWEPFRALRTPVVRGRDRLGRYLTLPNPIPLAGKQMCE